MDHTAKEVLLILQVILQLLELLHHVLELRILLVGRFFLLQVAIKHTELVLEFPLDDTGCNSFAVLISLVLLGAVDFDEVGELGALLAFTDLDDDAHGSVLQAVSAVGLILIEGLKPLGDMKHIVYWELAFLLEELVLVDEEFPAEGSILVLLNQLLHRVVLKLEELDVSGAPHVNIHGVLHEDGALVDH